MQFIINDTLKKLKGDNPLNANAQGLAHAVGSAVQQQFVYQAQSSPQPQAQEQAQQSLGQQSYHTLHTVLQAACSPTLAINNSNQHQQQQMSPAPVTVSFPTSNKSFLETSLLQAIPQIPAQPPICIFDDEESPTDLPAGGNIVILTEQSHAPGVTGSGLPCSGITIAPSPSSCSSSTTTLSNFNSITSPSPVVPDLLLSTPPGVNSSLNNNNNSTTSTSSHIFQQLQQQSHSNNNNNTKKADRRPPSSSINASTGSGSGNANHPQHHFHHNQAAQAHNHHVLSSPTSSPSKRQKNSNKECSSSSRSTALTSLASSRGSNNVINASSTPANNPSTSAAVNKREAPAKFFNIHEKIKELYLQLLSQDLNHFAETGVCLSGLSISKIATNLIHFFKTFFVAQATKSFFYFGASGGIRTTQYHCSQFVSWQ